MARNLDRFGKEYSTSNRNRRFGKEYSTLNVPCHYGLVLEVGGVVVHMLARRSCCDEVEKPLRFGMNRPARRDDECDELVVFGVAGFVVFRVRHFRHF